MVESIFSKLLTEIGIQTDDAECSLMGEICNFCLSSSYHKSCMNLYHPKTKECITNAIVNPNGSYKSKYIMKAKVIHQVMKTGHQAIINGIQDIEDIQGKE